MKRIRRAYELFFKWGDEQFHLTGLYPHLVVVDGPQEPIDWEKHINQHREGLASGKYEAVWFRDVLVTRPKGGD